ncbi:hypothetical protein G7Y79_00020g047970 [Physcia stellaris]|nr:hypothetical protein G7Y79_00020g047970 [Physcia stellaris]
MVHHGSRKKLGLDCPESIFKAVTLDAEASAEKRRHAVDVKDQRDREESRALLQRLFPHMPASSMETILNHGFAKGSGRVGRTKTLDEAAKANLVVNAHIRHNHTAYDSLYSTMKLDNNKQDVKVRARMAVYKQVQKIAETWRTGGTNSDVTPIDLEKPAKVSKQEPNIDSTVSNQPNMHHADSDADVAMEDVDETTNHRSARVKRHDRRVASGGVQKTLQVERTRPTRIQPKRGLAALDAALASMDLNQTISVANPETFKIGLEKPNTSEAQPRLRQQKIAVTANIATIGEMDSRRLALDVSPKGQNMKTLGNTDPTITFVCRESGYRIS